MDWEKSVIEDHNYIYAGYTYTGKQLINGDVDFNAIIGTCGTSLAISLLEAIDDDGKAFYMIATNTNGERWQKTVDPNATYKYQNEEYTGQELLDSKPNFNDLITNDGIILADSLIEAINDDGYTFYMISDEY